MALSREVERKKTRRVVGVADLQVSNDASESLVTYGLGSCIAVALYDPKVRVAGLLHYMLPLSKTDPIKARSCPYMFGDTGIPALFRSVYDLGATKRNIEVYVAGGAQTMDGHAFFSIGKRNYTILRRIFLKNGVSIKAVDVGGSHPRTLELHVGTGEASLTIGSEMRSL